MFGTTLTGSLAAAFLHELYYGPAGVDADGIQIFLPSRQPLLPFSVYSSVLSAAL